MTPWLLLVAWLFPLLLAGTYLPWAGNGKRPGPAPVGLGPWRGALLISAPLPALAAALTLPVGTTLPLPWLFLGTELQLDGVARVYLTFTSLLWLAAAVYAAFGFRGDVHARRFAALFLLAMAGNLWLIVGRDLPSFYVGFAIMGLASYGLVIHDGSTAALRAGKVYLVMALLGEVSLFAALVLIVQQTGTTLPSPDDLASLDGLAIGLMLVGLGVKAGMVPLHLWLPLAHPAAPIPASAVLSGTMIKVALLGWMRFLPLGVVALPDWGGLLATLGLVTLFYALPIGLVQADPKTVLAYSSISKMGLMMLLLGLILIEPVLAPLGVAAIALYAAHHALVKGGLFLGVGLRKHAPLQPLVLGALVFLALALAGAPYTSGAVAKYGTKPLIDAAQWPWLAAAIVIGAVGTTLLMGRFIWVSVRARPHPEPGWLWPGLAWTVLLALVALFPFVVGQADGLLTNTIAVPIGIALAALVGIAAWVNPSWLRPLIGLIPPGDLVALTGPLRRAVIGLWLRLWHPLHHWLQDIQGSVIHRFDRVFGSPPGDTERGLRAWPVAGGLWIGITALLTWLLLAAQPLVPASTDRLPAAPAPTTTVPREPAEPSESTAPVEPEQPDEDAPDVTIIRPSPDVVILADRSRQDELVTPEQGDGDALKPREREALAEPGIAIATDASTPTAARPSGEVAPTDEPAAPATLEAPGPDPAADVPAASEQPAPSAAEPDAPPAAPEPTSGPREAPAQPQRTVPKPADAQASRCDPDEPYRFTPAGGGDTVELAHCTRAADGTPISVPAPDPSRPLILAVQQALAARGHDPGPIDGLMGPRTRAAIRQLRQDRGLDAASVLDFDTLDLLQAQD
jgi:formate hydrogenlyase subunit 3/multisubunit Na+/H+ antiporter MnhD subunit